MSRCQHNQKISKFCISSHCNHPQSGGCEYCFKRYHCHIGQTKSITQNQVNQITKYLTSFQDKKYKIRPLKEAIYNYFNIIKGQISTYLDCLSSDLLNKISYPYIKKQGNLNTFKKIKHKQLNKLTTQQLIRLVNFKQQNDPQKLQKNQIMNYIQQSKEVHKKISSIHSLYLQIQKQSQQSYLGESIMSVSIFYKKIMQIYQNIQNQKKNIQKNFQLDSLEIGQKFKKQGESKNAGQSNQLKINKKQIQSSTYNNNGLKTAPQSEHGLLAQKRKIQVTFQSQQLKPQNNSINIKAQEQDKRQVRQTRSRQVSIDSRCGEVGLVKSRLKTYEGKQKQISERKQKLQQMMSKSARKNYGSQSSGQNETKEEKQQSINSIFIQKDRKFANNNQQRPHAQKLLPQGKQQTLLYQQHQAVQKKTLKIPVSVIPQNVEDEQIQSPILKLKKSSKPTTTGNSIFQLGLFKVQAAQSSQARSEPIQKAPQSKSNTSSQSMSDKQNQLTKLSLVNPTQSMNLTQKQTNSLILLAQSLKMPANKAIPLLQASLKYSPNNFSAAQYLSYLYLQQNKPKQCLKICNQALKLISGQANSVQLSMHLYNNKAAALNLLGRFSQSIPILQKCIQVKKKDILFKNLGDSYFNLGITQKAVINYQNATILNDQNHQALYNLAVCLYLQKNFQMAKLKVQRSLMLDHSNQNYLELYKQLTGTGANHK